MKQLRIVSLFTLVSLLIGSIVQAQVLKNYNQQWEKVEGFVKKDLPASALVEVKKIYALVKKEKQDAQLIKSLIFISGLQEEIREDNQIKSIAELEKESMAASEPVKAVLYSIIAEQYWSYYQMNRYALYDRTTTVDFKKEDISTWSTEDFFKKITDLYLLSIKNEKLLQQTKLEGYEAILLKGNMRHLRPTLYDFLAHRALEFFKTDERYLNRPAYSFEINTASAFDPTSDFIHRKFTTEDTLSNLYRALKLYQQLIAFHINDTRYDALIDVDLDRYEFVRAHSTHPDKETYYYNGVNHIAHQYGTTPAAAQAWYLVARYFDERAQKYSPYGDTSYRYDRRKAKEICESVLTQKDSSEGRINCFNLLNTITQKNLEFSLEKVNVPNAPFRSLIEYRNINQLYLRMVKLDEKSKASLLNNQSETNWNLILNLPPVKNWEQPLPDNNDFQLHRAEIKIESLPVGEYLLIVAADRDFKNSKMPLSIRSFFVSNISYINQGKTYFVLDRTSGQPLIAADVQAWEPKYDSKTSRNKLEKFASYKTDKNGSFIISSEKNKPNEAHSLQFAITHGKDFLGIDETDYHYFYTRGKQPVVNNSKPHLFLFSDRSIYRPGQTIYFKGILIEENEEKKGGKIVANRPTVIYLRDVNYQIVDSVKLSTNEYGSLNGKFQLPAVSSINGTFTIESNYTGAQGIRVEEYKRPKFFVDFEPIKATYKVNDTISITGIAKAYAGNNIDGAKVKYRVVRQPRFIYWRSYLPPVSRLEIIHGEIVTDKDGKFTIRFEAIPDLKIDRKQNPLFDYFVYADITDVNGETRSGSETVTAGYQSILLKVDAPVTIPVDSLKKISVRTENMNGQFQSSRVTVTISKLKTEQRLIRNRYWERPDQFVMSKEEYIQNFPYDEYDNETNKMTWSKEQTVFERTDTTRQNAVFDLAGFNAQPGMYAIEIVTKDPNGEEIKDKKYVELQSTDKKSLDFQGYFLHQATTGVEPGEKAIVTLGSSAKDLHIIQQIDQSNDPEESDAKLSFISISAEKKEFQFPITEAERGGFGINWVFVKHNRVYQYSNIIAVPWTNKELSIEYATYRDKAAPGANEKWKLKISGYKNEKAAAEILASMYDASLDQFDPHSWYQPNIYSSYSGIHRRWMSNNNFSKVTSYSRYTSDYRYKELLKEYDRLISIYGFEGIGNKYDGNRRQMRLAKNAPPTMERLEVMGNASIRAQSDSKIAMTEVVTTDEAFLHEEIVKSEATGSEILPDQSAEVSIRKNFNETAFFFPELYTDSSGAIEFSFTLPDALTKWKFQAFAHTKELAFGYSSKEIVTQKDLMVQPNAPRFLREGDKMEFSAKIVNLSEKELTGTAEFQLFDAATNEPVDGRFQSMVPNQYFTVAAGQSEAVRFPIEVPFQFNKAVVWRIVAKAGDFSDGEENILPVLTNRMLVTESITMPMKGNGTKEFKFDKLINSVNSETLQHHALTVEYTSNPAWYAVQSLPYLMEYPYECAEQIWNRYYANALASMIVNSAPGMKAIFEQWKNVDTSALLSNLEKNQELKSVLLEETPWVLQAKTESQQKKNIALLFDMIRMSNELNTSLEKLSQMQLSNGGFPWFAGGQDDRYITQYILTGIGRLKKLNALSKSQLISINRIVEKAVVYLDSKIRQDYNELQKNKTNLKIYIPYNTQVQYFYMRSFFPEYKVPAAIQPAYNYFMSRLPLSWTKENKYLQGMIALVLHRKGDSKNAAAILKSLKETSILNEELGRYWKDASRSWWWQEAPIERQALLIEAFQEAGKDLTTVDELRTWLLKNKQTNNWETTKATADACYALLMQGNNWLNNDPVVTIRLGNNTIKSGTELTEAGTGYFKKTIDGPRVFSTMGNISVTVSPATNTAPGPQVQNTSWGSVYWQYFEDLDKITTAATPLKLVKKLFVETNTDRGPVLKPLVEGESFKVGDKVKVRIELKVDRDMEYVHMKDMRASGLEPTNVLSGYRWQGGLGYYETTKDASTNFFFSNLRKGSYVFEYTLFASQAGNFSNGITTIQSMYAPEFTAHSEGIRVSIE